MDHELPFAPNARPKSRTWQRRAFALLGAVLIAVVWGSVVQTQFNITSLQSIGADISGVQRLRMTALDLIGFSPIYSAIVSLGMLCALPLAALLARRWPGHRSELYALAGAVGIATAIRIVDIATPAPTLIAATRGIGGWLLMSLGAALAGWWFARRTSGD
ncbi:MAG: hypothetical protein SGI99_10595 [Pseudomonadota bacterium]|nr:hypothetical protein [Pseudomonadota bacterium]